MYDNNNSNIYESASMPPTIPRPIGFNTDNLNNSQPGSFPVVPPIACNSQPTVDCLSQIVNQEKKSIDQRLRQDFPANYVFAQSALLILIGLTVFSLQIVLTVNKTPLSLLVSGIWSGLLCIVIGIVCILLSTQRGLALFKASIFLSIIGAFVLFVGLVAINIYALFEYEKCVIVGNRCSDPNNRQLNIAMIVLGLIAITLLIVYVIVINLIMRYYCFVNVYSKPQVYSQCVVNPTVNPVNPINQSTPYIKFQKLDKL